MLSKLEQYPIISILVIVTLMLGISISALDVSIMEARNYITAREMLTDGNWLLTTMNGEPRYQKPPLPTWLAAISALLFGAKTIFVYRLPAILMVILTGITAFLLSNKLLKNKEHSLINALITITSFYVIVIIIEAPWDIFTHGFMLVAILHLFQLFEKDKQYWKHTLIAGVFFGLSILSKGPVSFYALLLPFLISYGIVYKYKQFKLKVFSIVSFVIIALLIGGWWYLYVRIEDPDTFTAITSKETKNWGSYNVRPFYYYWSFFTQSGLWTIPAFIALLYPYMKSRVSNLKAYKFSLLWTVLAVVLLSLIPEKKSRYLMPVLIPMAINTGFYIEYLIRRFKDLKNKKETFPVYFNFGLIGLIAVLFPISYFFIKEQLAEGTLIWFIIASIGLLAIGVLILYHLKKKHLKQVFLACVCFVVFAMITLPQLSKTFKEANYNPIDNLHIKLAENDINLYALGDISPEMIWQFGDKIPSLKNVPNLLSEDVFGILTRDLSKLQNLETLKEQYIIDFKETFDLNIKAPETRGYKERLYNDFYLFTKKK